MNLVMIGEFKEVRDAEEAKRVIDKLIEQVANDADMDQENTVPQDRFTDAISELLRSVNVYSLAPAELEQFLYDVRVSVESNKVVITTDEIDVSAFLKVLLDKGARVKVYSAHDYPDTGYGR